MLLMTSARSRNHTINGNSVGTKVISARYPPNMSSACAVLPHSPRRQRHGRQEQRRAWRRRHGDITAITPTPSTVLKSDARRSRGVAVGRPCQAAASRAAGRCSWSPRASRTATRTTTTTLISATTATTGAKSARGREGRWQSWTTLGLEPRPP
ncbi:unnamed protein product [Ectocarpus sp. 12 AP-2014]